MIFSLLASSSMVSAVQWNVIAPFGTLSANSPNFNTYTLSHLTQGSTCGGNGPTSVDTFFGNQRVSDGPQFNIEDENGFLKPVQCLPEQDPPCIGRVNRQRPTYPTGIIFEPIRENFNHQKVSVRYDAIVTSEHWDPKATGLVHGTGLRAMLAVTNPTHVKRTTRVRAVNVFDNDGVEATESSPFQAPAGDLITAADHWAIFSVDGGDDDDDDNGGFMLYVWGSSCRDKSHHISFHQADQTDVLDGTTCADTRSGLSTSFTIEVASEDTGLIALVQESFPGNDFGLRSAIHRAHEITRRHNHADLHWFADLTDQERRAVRNFCVDDDDGDDTDDDDDSSSSSSSSSSSDTSSFSSSDFSFSFHDSSDEPIQSSTARRYRGAFSSDFSSSKLYTSTVDSVEGSSSSSSSSSSSRKPGHVHHHMQEQAGEGEGEGEAAAATTSSDSSSSSSSSSYHWIGKRSARK